MLCVKQYACSLQQQNARETNLLHAEAFEKFLISNYHARQSRLNQIVSSA